VTLLPDENVWSAVHIKQHSLFFISPLKKEVPVFLLRPATNLYVKPFGNATRVYVYADIRAVPLYCDILS